jgi:hypothetical protein
MSKKPCVGLFGTCGDSTWRAPFIQKFKELGIDYFNPQVAEWDPSCAEREALHLAHDEILVYPILGETYGTASLAESGYAVAQALKEARTRHVLLYVEPTVAPHLKEQNPALAKESERARHLVRAHLGQLHVPTVHLCESLDELLERSVQVAQSV